ncbi:hypothetical protein DM15PD_14640 [Aristophania vespae]|nr:hypothetical protein DM15PD_14640 [Aristophania vespae]
MADMNPDFLSKDSPCNMVDDLVGYASNCLLAYLRNDPKSLVQESAVFLKAIETLWVQHGISEQDVWEEMSQRILLSETLLKRGIRARKGGPYRSTKLP